MSSASLNKISSILFKHKLMSKYTESRIKQKEDNLDPKSPSNVLSKQEDADIEDNNLIDDTYDKKKITLPHTWIFMMITDQMCSSLQDQIPHCLRQSPLVKTER